jgi:hypothetical protein
LNPVEAVNARRLYGGPSPGQTMMRANEAGERLTADRSAVEQVDRRLADAARLLEKRIDSFIAG